MDGFDLVNEATVAGIKCHYLRSQRTGLALILAAAPTPIAGMSVIVPTMPETDEGEPHCLEHLIFRGSKKYPVAGYMEQLSMAMVSCGTNAYTVNDRTVYTASLVGQEGLFGLLPVYLDHILHPLLTQADFDTEVFHISPEGENKGVVYCEMESCSVDPQEIAVMSALRQAYPEGCGQRLNSGGDIHALVNLTNEKVKAMHARYYKPSNLVVLVVGQVDLTRLCETIRRAEEDLSLPQSDVPYHSVWCDGDEPPIPPASIVLKTYPGDAEDADCHVQLGFRSPCWADSEFRAAVEVIGTYLTEGPAAPINAEIVERENDSLASTVAYSSSESRWPTLFYTFEDCPPEKMRMIGDRFLDVIRSLEGDGDISQWDQTRLQSIIDNKIWEELDGLENSPQDHIDWRVSLWIVHSREEEMLNGKSTLRDAICHDEVLRRLRTQPPSYWKGLLRLLFLDRPCYETLVMPSALHGQLSDLQKKRLCEKRLAPGAPPIRPLEVVDESERKRAVAELLKKNNVEPLIVTGNARLVLGSNFSNCGPQGSVSPMLADYGCAALFVHLKIEDEIQYQSGFVDMSMLVNLSRDVTQQSLWSFLQSKPPKAKKSRMFGLDVDIREFLKDLREIDYEARWKEKEEANKDEGGEKGKNEKQKNEMDDEEESEWGSCTEESEEDVDFDDHCHRALLFVLDNVQVGHLMALLSHCIFNSDLRLPKKLAVDLGLEYEVPFDLGGRNLDSTTLVTVTSKNLQNKLCGEVLEYDMEMGLDSSNVFNSLMYICWKASLSHFGSNSLKLLRAVLECTHLTQERMLVTLKKDLSYYNNRMREGKALLPDFTHLKRYGWEEVVNSGNSIVQALICRVAVKYPEVFLFLLEQLYPLVKDSIFSTHTHLHVASGDLSYFDCSGETPPVFLKVFNELRRSRTPLEDPTYPTYYTQQVKDVWAQRGGQVIAVTCPSIDSGHMTLTSPLPDQLTPQDPMSYQLTAENALLFVILEFLRSAEGPVFQPVRDCGAAYGPSFSFSYDQRLQSLLLRECTNPAQALNVALKSLRDVLTNVEKIQAAGGSAAEARVLFPNQDHFYQARAAALHAVVNELITPRAAADAALDAWLRGLPLDNDVQMIKKVEAVEYKDFLEGLRLLLQSLLDFEDTRCYLITTIEPPSKGAELEDMIGTLQMTHSPVSHTLIHKRATQAMLEATKSEGDFLALSLESILQARMSLLVDDYNSDSESDEDDESD